MKPLSQSEYGEIRDLYTSVYVPTENIEEELVHEICDELIEELIAEGYSEEDAIDIVEDATNDYIDEAKVTFGSDTAPMRKSGAPVGAKRRFAMRRAGDAVKKAGDAAKGAVDSAKRKASVAKAGAQIAGSIAKDEARRAGRKAALAVTTAPGKAKAAASDAKKKAKSGIKGFIKRQAQKVVSRMSEGISAAGAVKAGADSLSDRARKEEFDMVDEGLTGARAQRARQMQDSEVKKGGGKRTLADRDTAFRLGTGTGPGRVSDRPIKSQSDQGKGNAAKRRMKMEELEATGLFSEKEIEAIMEAEMREGYDEPKMHSAVKRVMTTQPAAKGRAASRLHSKYSMRSKGNVAGETDGPGPNAPKRSGRKGRGAETDRGSGNAAKRRMEG